ncbi:hypothetical protein BJY04DRAFT_219738 [Aspergillus karnatakaensis]|uniref:NAD(P)/FAD-dependent oxidoreductase n=1 Tax=Aspergillus karnatakaensis TaxID=1810916 RepID=UPI003CCD668A
MSLPTQLGMTTPLLDALIIGAGPAGLSVATGLARQLHTAVVFDSGLYRNARTSHMHNVVGWDHANPKDFRKKAREDLLARYSTIRFEDRAIEAVRKVHSESEKENKKVFEATDTEGNAWYARKLVLATGVKDLPLDIPGFEECWGTNIFHCLFCDGYEERGQKSVGVLATGPLTTIPSPVKVLRMASRLAESVTVYTNGNEGFATLLENEVEGLNVVFENRVIKKFEKGETGARVVVHFEKEGAKEEGFLVYAPEMKVNGPFAEQLGLRMTPAGDIEVSQPFFETSEAGVFAVGDIAGPIKAVTPAIYSGTMVAAGLAAQVQAE